MFSVTSIHSKALWTQVILLTVCWCFAFLTLRMRGLILKVLYGLFTGLQVGLHRGEGGGILHSNSSYTCVHSYSLIVNILSNNIIKNLANFLFLHMWYTIIYSCSSKCHCYIICNLCKYIVMSN